MYLSNDVLQNQIDFSLFSYDELLDELQPNMLQSHINTQSVQLLSQIKGIDSEIVATLENFGIYDTDEFSEVAEKLVREHHFPGDIIEDIQEKVTRSIKSMMDFPRIILNFPENYAFISAFKEGNHFYLGINWRGLSVKFHEGIDNWNQLSASLEELREKMNYPEFIGRVLLSSSPVFLDELTPLSTYISNLPLDQTLLDIAIAWGLTAPTADFDELDLELMALSYLIRLAELSG